MPNPERASTQSAPTRSPGYTITFGEGVNDEIQKCLLRLRQTQAQEYTAVSCQELAACRQRTITQMTAFLHRLVGSILSSNTRDQNVQINVDGPESFFFVYDSGYHGAMIFQPNPVDPFASSWALHT